MYSISCLVSVPVYASDNPSSIISYRQFALTGPDNGGGSRDTPVSGGSARYSSRPFFPFASDVILSPSGFATSSRPATYSVSGSNTFTYQYGYSPDRTLSGFLNYFPYRFVLTTQSLQSTKFTLDGSFGLSISTSITVGNNPSYDLTSSQSYVNLYVNGHLVDSWYTPYGSLTFNNYVYEGDAIVTSVYLDWQLRGPYIQGLTFTSSRRTLNCYTFATLRAYGPDAQLPTPGSATPSSVDGLPYDDPEGGTPPVVNPDTGTLPEPEPEPNPNQGVEDAIGEQTEAQKGFFASVLEFFDSFFSNIAHAIIGVFIPLDSEGNPDFGSVFDDLSDALKAKLGFLAETIDLLDTFFRGLFSHAPDGSYLFDFPGIKFSFSGTSYTLVSPGTIAYSGDTFIWTPEIGSPTTFDNKYFVFVQHNLLGPISLLIVFFAILRTLQTMYEIIIEDPFDTHPSVRG